MKKKMETRFKMNKVLQEKYNGKLPEYYVIDGEPDMMEKLMQYAQQGIRSVEVLTQAEYKELIEWS